MKRYVIAAAVLLGLVACGSNDEEGRGDAGVSAWDDAPAYVINMPDTFMNLAFKCHGTVGLYAHTRPATPVVVVDHPACVART